MGRSALPTDHAHDDHVSSPESSPRGSTGEEAGSRGVWLQLEGGDRRSGGEPDDTPDDGDAFSAPKTYFANTIAMFDTSHRTLLLQTISSI